MWGPPAPVPAHYWRWEVGWRLPSGRFIDQEGTTESTVAAAVFGAEQTLASLLRHAPAVRQRFTGRLLVPRTAAPRPGTDPALDVVSLRSLLLAVFNEDRSASGGPEPDGDRWPPVPHTGSDGQLGSLTAALFDHISLPFPDEGESANNAVPGSPAFTRFLAQHAVVLTPPALTYLADLSGTHGLAAVRDRHAAGLRAVLDGGADYADRLTADLGPLPTGMAWTDLSDPTTLERFLDEPAVEGRR